MEFSTIHSWFLDVYGFHEKNIFLATRKSVEISMTRNSRAFLAGDSNFMELKCGQRIKTSVFVGGIVHSTRGVHQMGLILGGIKQYKSMAIWRECIVWVGNTMTPLRSMYGIFTCLWLIFMVILRDFPYNDALFGVGVILMTPA